MKRTSGDGPVSGVRLRHPSTTEMSFSWRQHSIWRINSPYLVAKNKFIVTFFFKGMLQAGNGVRGLNSNTITNVSQLGASLGRPSRHLAPVSCADILPDSTPCFPRMPGSIPALPTGGSLVASPPVIQMFIEHLLYAK